jgi:2-aminophenol/2-amino-5-chlorophenol 1,6-dioxygenase alpha subunit
MPLVAALLVPGSPLPYLRPDNPPWKPIAEAYRAAATALQAARPDVLLVYSTQWIAVLDQLWQSRARVTGLHVDENWYEFGNLPFDLAIDTEVTASCIESTASIGVRSKGVDYDGFPIDTGTIVANGSLNADGRARLVIAANNVYHDWTRTSQLAAIAATTAERYGRRYAVVGVGGLSGTIFRTEIDLAQDRIAGDENDALNRGLLARLQQADVSGLAEFCADYAKRTRADMGMKHLAWILGGLGDRYRGADVLGYGPTYGAGAAIVQFRL